MKRTAPEPAPPLQISAPHQSEDVWPSAPDIACIRLTYMADLQWNGGFEPGALRSRSQDLATSNANDILGRPHILNLGQVTNMTPEPAYPLQTFAPHNRKDSRPSTSDLACTRPIYTIDLCWNRVSNLEPFDPEVETLPQG
ncbi:hypothetical protein AVEN_225221-1 [Araneus ventricosus]|uniref:Uncharacterized protein n=1 Tax=Araneus ventricosus TaxID=182803 RepID=A0A4Y2AKZ3_ARAVE|nr:hypothetical protein AVEN_225221-1 [Araneus ventricosus]